MPIYKTKNNTYYIRIYQNGKQKTKRGFKTKKQAEQYEAALILQNEDTLQKIENKEPSITFKSIYIKFLEMEKKRVKIFTYDNNIYLIEKNILKFFGSKKIKNINIELINSWYDHINKLDVTYKYKNRLLRLLSKIFDFASLYYNIENKVKFLPNFTNIKVEDMMDDRIYNIQQFKQFISSIEIYEIKVFFETLFYTGIRVGEIRALTWKDINFSESSIRINKAAAKIKGGDIITPPKTSNSIRNVFMPKILSNSLQALYDRKKSELLGFKEDWFVFGDVKMISKTTIDRWNRKTASNSNIFRIKIHNFRHSYITMMFNDINEGIAPKIIQKQVGHSSISTTLDIYTHLKEEKRKKEILNTLDNLEKSV